MMPIWLSATLAIIFIIFAGAFEVAEHRHNDHQALLIGLGFIGFVAMVGLSCFVAAMPQVLHAFGVTGKAGVTRLFEWLILSLGILSIPIFVSTPSIGQNDNGKFIAIASLLGVGLIGGAVVALL